MIKFFKQFLQEKKSEYIFLSLILLGAFLVRLYKIDSPVADWHSWRQADTASVSREYLIKGINLLYPTYHDISSIQTGYNNPEGYRFVEFPIFNAIHSILAKNFGFLSFDSWGRMVSVISSLISIYLIFLLGNKFIDGRWGGILSAFFFAFLPFNIYFSRVILPEPMAVTFGLLSIWLSVKFTDKKSYIWLFLSAAFFSLAMLIKPFTFFYFFPVFYIVSRNYPRLKNYLEDSKAVIAIGIAFAPFFLWRIWINKFPEGIPHFWWAFNGDFIRFRPAFWRWIFAERIGSLVLGMWGLIPFSFGLLKKNSKNMINILFFLGALIYLVLVATANVRHDYYQIYIIPPISLLLAQGSLVIWNGARKLGFYPILSRGLLVFAIAMMFLVSGYQIKEFYKINHPEIIEAGKALDKIAPKDALVIAPYNGDTAFLYQTERRGWPVVEDSFENLIRLGADYYISVNVGDLDSQYIIKNYEVEVETRDYVIANLGRPLKK